MARAAFAAALEEARAAAAAGPAPRAPAPPELGACPPLQQLVDAQPEPGIRLPRFAKRLARFAPCSEVCFVLALVYLDRLRHASDVRLAEPALGLVAVALLLVAAKFHDDKTFSNEFYAEIAGVTTRELNRWEHALLEALRFTLAVAPETYAEYSCRLALRWAVESR